MAKRRNPSQLCLFDDGDDTTSPIRASSTFVDNMALPVHRWFRYSAGFSAIWVRETIRAALPTVTKGLRVLDPFAGSGTVLVEAEKSLVPSIGVESHPFVARLAKAKTKNGTDASAFKTYSEDLLRQARKTKPNVERYPDLIRKCYPDDILAELDKIRSAWLCAEDAPEHELGWLALASILRQCSPVGTASWQYVLPKKAKARVANPFQAYRDKSAQMYHDLSERPKDAPEPRLVRGDARTMTEVPTSGPPWSSPRRPIQTISTTPTRLGSR